MYTLVQREFIATAHVANSVWVRADEVTGTLYAYVQICSYSQHPYDKNLRILQHPRDIHGDSYSTELIHKHRTFIEQERF